MNLRPPGRARPHRPAAFVKGNLLGPVKLFLNHERPGTDKRHVAAENIVELRKFVEPRLPQEAARHRKSRIALLRRLAFATLRILHAHRTELIQREDLPVPADSLLSKQDRSSGINQNRHSS